MPVETGGKAAGRRIVMEVEGSEVVRHGNTVVGDTPTV